MTSAECGLCQWAETLETSTGDEQRHRVPAWSAVSELCQEMALLGPGCCIRSTLSPCFAHVRPWGWLPAPHSISVTIGVALVTPSTTSCGPSNSDPRMIKRQFTKHTHSCTLNHTYTLFSERRGQSDLENFGNGGCIQRDVKLVSPN